MLQTLNRIWKQLVFDRKIKDDEDEAAQNWN